MDDKLPKSHSSVSFALIPRRRSLLSCSAAIRWCPRVRKGRSSTAILFWMMFSFPKPFFSSLPSSPADIWRSWSCSVLRERRCASQPLLLLFHLMNLCPVTCPWNQSEDITVTTQWILRWNLDQTGFPALSSSKAKGLPNPARAGAELKYPPNCSASTSSS